MAQQQGMAGRIHGEPMGAWRAAGNEERSHVTALRIAPDLELLSLRCHGRVGEGLAVRLERTEAWLDLVVRAWYAGRAGPERSARP